jgi:hypothetical protein
MKRVCTSVITGLLFSLPVFSQKFEPTVIASAGDISKIDNISLEWTLGETMVESNFSANEMFTQGFHQPVLYIPGPINEVSGVTKIASPGYDVFIAPNPVQSLLTIKVQQAEDERLYIAVSDIYGKMLFTKIAGSKNAVSEFDMNGIPSGCYFLTIKKSTGELIQTAKIIKTK